MSSTESAPELSIVVPVYNEAEVLPELFRRLTKVLASVPASEVVFVDDGSTDSSWPVLLDIAHTSDSVRLVRLSKNFGHQIALTAGLDAARGAAVVVMDSDLQDPPEVIPELVEQWRRGYDVVYAVRVERAGESRFKRITASLFYKLFKKLGIDIPEQAGDFRLLSRQAVDALRNMPERARFMRGMASWIGFPQTGVEYRRDARFAGETKYPFRKMLHFALDAITSFSTVPIRLVTILGFLVVAFCFVYLTYTLYLALFTDTTVQGWASVIVLILLLGGMQLVSLGVIGQYVGRIFDEVKRRPLYLVREVVEPSVDASPPADGQLMHGRGDDDDPVGQRRP